MAVDIVIHRNKSKVRKLMLLAFSAFVLTASAWWFLSGIAMGPMINIVLPLLAVALLIAGLVQVKAYFNNQPALVISDTGILDRSSGIGEVNVRWDEVTGIRTAKAQLNQFAVVQLRDPEKFIEGLRGYRKELAKGLMKQFGSPLALTANALDTDIAELERSLRARWEAHGRS